MRQNKQLSTNSVRIRRRPLRGTGGYFVGSVTGPSNSDVLNLTVRKATRRPCAAIAGPVEPVFSRSQGQSGNSLIVGFVGKSGCCQDSLLGYRKMQQAMTITTAPVAGPSAADMIVQQSAHAKPRSADDRNWKPSPVVLGPAHHSDAGCSRASRAAFRLRRCRRSTMTFTAATTRRALRTILVAISIVPSMRKAWTTVQMTMIATRQEWATRHARGRRPMRSLSATINATTKIAHMAITPQFENGVGELNVSASITSGGLVK